MGDDVGIVFTVGVGEGVAERIGEAVVGPVGESDT
jgi:hypothetical protein